MKNDFVLQVNQPVSCLDVSRDYIVCGTLEETVFIWKNVGSSSSAPILRLENQLMGVIDVAMDENETRIAVSCFDGLIRLWDIEETKCTEIKCEAFENWKVKFLDNDKVITGGEGGIMTIFHQDTKYRLHSLDTGKKYYITSIGVANHDDVSKICSGSEGGHLSLFVNNILVQKLQPHFKAIRDIQFLTAQKVLTASDDGLIKMVDVEKGQEDTYYFGHKYGVSGLDKHPNDQNLFVSCAYDRTIRFWDVRQKHSLRVIQAGNDRPESINGVKYSKDGKWVCSAHQNGTIGFTQ